MSENENDILELIRIWVWSGFYDTSLASEMLEDQLSEAWEDVDAGRVRKALADAFAEKARVEKTWPPETDCDRLDRVFAQLNAQGICALQNAGYTMSDGIADVSEELARHPRGHFQGYCFYHGQDLERALAGLGLMLAFGDLREDKNKSVLVGKSIQAAFERAGFRTSWDGTAATRIDVLQIDWKRRLR